MPSPRLAAADGRQIACCLAPHEELVFEENFAQARYTAGGALDSGFDGDGLVTTDFSP